MKMRVVTLVMALASIALIAGCGGEGGCNNVLGGRWSAWFLIPVTFLAAALYACVFYAAWPTTAQRYPARSAFILRSASVLAAGAALWFFALLFRVEKSFCIYCTAMHACGIAILRLVRSSATASSRR